MKVSKKANRSNVNDGLLKKSHKINFDFAMNENRVICVCLDMYLLTAILNHKLLFFEHINSLLNTISFTPWN